MTVPKVKIPDISPEEKSPVVSQLLGIIEQQSVILQLLVEEVQLLRAEIARLKNQKPKPRIPPSRLGKEPHKKKDLTSQGKRPGSINEKSDHTRNGYSDSETDSAVFYFQRAPVLYRTGFTFGVIQYSLSLRDVENTGRPLSPWPVAIGSTGSLFFGPEKVCSVSVLSMPCHPAAYFRAITGMGRANILRRTQPHFD